MVTYRLVTVQMLARVSNNDLPISESHSHAHEHASDRPSVTVSLMSTHLIGLQSQSRSRALDICKIEEIMRMNKIETMNKQ